MIDSITPMNDFDSFKTESKSAVKLTKNTKGINIEIKVVAGEEDKMDNLMRTAILTYKNLLSELKKIDN